MALGSLLVFCIRIGGILGLEGKRSSGNNPGLIFLVFCVWAGLAGHGQSLPGAGGPHSFDLGEQGLCLRYTLLVPIC